MSTHEEEPIFTADELRNITESVLEDVEQYNNEELANIWIQWFEKRAERYIKDAATKGLYEVTLDLPYDLSVELQKEIYKRIMKHVKKRLPGCDVAIIEEEYEDDIIYKVEISWR
jgi:hypothetical protein